MGVTSLPTKLIQVPDQQPGFTDIQLRRFTLPVGLPITIPNIVGAAYP